jgi:hypothetical protein
VEPALSRFAQPVVVNRIAGAPAIRAPGKTDLISFIQSSPA